MDFLIEFWEWGRLVFSFRLVLRALALLLWYCDLLSLSARSLFCIRPFLVEGLSLVLPIIERETALYKVLSYFLVCFSIELTLWVSSTSCFCMVSVFIWTLKIFCRCWRYETGLNAFYIFCLYWTICSSTYLRWSFRFWRFSFLT